MHRGLAAIGLLLISAFIVSCGGGGSGGGSGSSAPGGSGGTSALASVSVLLTDASSDDYDEAIATITSIVLIGENGQQTIFSGSVTVDLLKLRDFVELLAIDDQVQPDIISKIRLTLTSLVFIKRDEQGGIAREDVATLVANGKIDLNPQEDFIIHPGDKLFISFDFDVDKSLKVTETGNGKFIVRPVIFVHIGRLPGFKNGLTRVFGEIREIGADFLALQLCRSRLISSPSDMGEDDGEQPERCIRVLLDENTGLFGNDGLPIDVTDLIVGDPATVVGHFRLEDDDDSDSDSDSDGDSDSDSDGDSDSDSDGDGAPPDLDFVLRAIVIEGGPMGTYARIRGELTSGVDATNDSYGLLVAPSQGFAPDTMLTGQLFPKSRIFRFNGEEIIDRSVLMAGDGTLVDGVIVLNESIPEQMDGGEDTLRSAFMLVRLGDVTEPPEPEEETLVGKILTLDSTNQSLVVATATGDRCVLADDALILFLIESEGMFDVIKGTFDDLIENIAIVAFGVEDTGGCFDANFIVSQGPMKPGPEPEPL